MNASFRFLRMTSILALIAILSIAGETRAQCPTDIAPISGPSWSTATTHLQYGTTGCYYTVYFCQRQVSTSPSVWQYYIYKVKPDISNPYCDGIQPQDMINDAQSKAATLPPTLPCNDNVMVTTAEVYRSVCWGMEQDPNDLANVFQGCGQGAYCKKTCTVCYDVVDKKNVASSCSYSQLGGPPYCNLLGSDGPTWILHHCYIIACGNQ